MEIIQRSTKHIGDRYECGVLPPNGNKRFRLLKNTFKKDMNFKLQYNAKMEDLFKKRYARRLNGNELTCSSRTFFLPHFAVKNPNKTGTRIVFDAAAKINGVSLNDSLLAGPDLNITVNSVLLNFREVPIGVCGDIREMFIQVAIIKDDINAQRFLWKSENDLEDVQQCVMSRMIFGAACSPTIAQFIKIKKLSCLSIKNLEQ